MKYIALLRGINVGGNNKVPMADLRLSFESIGFSSVRTYINSGNVIFETPARNIPQLTSQCERVIEDRFGFPVVCTVIRAEDLYDAIAHAPQWWGTDITVSHNALFVIPPATPAQVMQSLGQIRSEYESVGTYGSIIFWSAPRETIGRTRYSKIPGTALYRSITIRNANTTKKLADLSH